MSETSSVKDRIISVRTDLGMGVTKFAAEIGVPHQNLSNIETGRTKPTLDVVTAICKKFGISPAWLGLNIGPKYMSEQQFGEGIEGFLEDMARKSEELNKYPFEKFLERTLEPANFKDRNPWVNAPGLFRLLEDQDATEKLDFTSDELSMLEKAIESNPALYNQADSELFLQLIKSYRKQRLALIEQFLAVNKEVE